MRFFRDLIAAFATVIVVLVLFEVGLRLAGVRYESSFYESDPVLYMALRPRAEGWEIKEGENFVRINSWGMRDEERSLVPAPGTLRVALLGDSMVAAEEVPLDKTMAKVLESKLSGHLGSPSAPVEVLNFGVGGFTLAQEYLMLENRVWQFRPDIVVLFLSPSSVPSCSKRLYPGNFPFFVVSNGDLVPDPATHPPAESSPEARHEHALLGNLMNQIRLFQLVRKATQDGIPREIAQLSGSRRRTRNTNILNMWLHPPASPEQANAWQVADRILGLMAEGARDHGAEFWLSAIGPEVQDNPNATAREAFLQKERIKTFDYAENRLQSIANVHGIGFIALEHPLLEYAEHNHVSLRGFFNTRPNYGHWNENGNNAAATIVADKLIEYHSHSEPSVRAAHKLEHVRTNDGS